MIGALSPYISKIRRSYQSNDIIDRLNYQYTATIISLAAFTLAATQYVGKPIQCWVPPEYTGAWEKYAETYCFAKGSYFLPIDEEIDESYSQREKVQIGYYQWVPLVLAFMAIMFYLPSFIWKALNFNTANNSPTGSVFFIVIPCFFLPFFYYYPTEEDRETDRLIPCCVL